METLIFDTSAILNFGQRGQLEPLLEKLSDHSDLFTTHDVLGECNKGEQKAFYAKFIAKHFDIKSAHSDSLATATYIHLTSAIHMGEVSVIALASEMKGIAVLDDRIARSEARKLGIQVIGTLGLLNHGITKGWHTDDDCLEIITRLRANKFRIHPPGANDSFAEYFKSFGS